MGHETRAVQQNLLPAATAAAFLLAKELTSIVGINYNQGATAVY